MPSSQLSGYLVMLPRLQAEQLLAAAQVSMLPHYSGTKHDKNRGQRLRSKIIAMWQQLARPPEQASEYDRYGRRILRSFESVRDTFREWGVMT
jgi:hypothetical protein